MVKKKGDSGTAMLWLLGVFMLGLLTWPRFLPPAEEDPPLPKINFTPNESSTDYGSADWKSGFYDGQDAGEEEAQDNPECFFDYFEVQGSPDYASGYEAGYEDSCESINKNDGGTEDDRAEHDPLRGW